MEGVGVVKDGRIELPASVHLAEGRRVPRDFGPEGDAAVRVRAVAETSVLADIAVDHGASIQSVIVVAGAGPASSFTGSAVDAKWE